MPVATGRRVALHRALGRGLLVAVGQNRVVEDPLQLVGAHRPGHAVGLDRIRRADADDVAVAVGSGREHDVFHQGRGPGPLHAQGDEKPHDDRSDAEAPCPVPSTDGTPIPSQQSTHDTCDAMCEKTDAPESPSPSTRDGALRVVYNRGYRT